MSLLASLLFKGQMTKHGTVKWTITATVFCVCLCFSETIWRETKTNCDAPRVVHLYVF